MQLDPDDVWYVPLSVPVIDNPLAATLALPDAASAAPRPIVWVNEKVGKLTVWPETLPENVVDGTPGTWATSSTWTAAPVWATVARNSSARVSDGRFAEQVDDAVRVVP